VAAAVGIAAAEGGAEGLEMVAVDAAEGAVEGGSETSEMSETAVDGGAEVEDAEVEDAPCRRSTAGCAGSSNEEAADGGPRELDRYYTADGENVAGESEDIEKTWDKIVKVGRKIADKIFTSTIDGSIGGGIGYAIGAAGGVSSSDAAFTDKEWDQLKQNPNFEAVVREFDDVYGRRYSKTCGSSPQNYTLAGSADDNPPQPCTCETGTREKDTFTFGWNIEHHLYTQESDLFTRPILRLQTKQFPLTKSQETEMLFAGDKVAPGVQAGEPVTVPLAIENAAFEGSPVKLARAADLTWVWGADPSSSINKEAGKFLMPEASASAQTSTLFKTNGVSFKKLPFEIQGQNGGLIVTSKKPTSSYQINSQSRVSKPVPVNFVGLACNHLFLDRPERTAFQNGTANITVACNYNDSAIDLTGYKLTLKDGEDESASFTIVSASAHATGAYTLLGLDRALKRRWDLGTVVALFQGTGAETNVPFHIDHAPEIALFRLNTNIRSEPLFDSPVRTPKSSDILIVNPHESSKEIFDQAWRDAFENDPDVPARKSSIYTDDQLAKGITFRPQKDLSPDEGILFPVRTPNGIRSMQLPGHILEYPCEPTSPNGPVQVCKWTSNTLPKYWCA
jgi:hypothetical protein